MRLNILDIQNDREDFIFENPERDFSASCVLVEQFLLKISLKGRLTHPDSLLLIEKLHKGVSENINQERSNRAFYMLIEASNLTAIDYRSKKQLSKFLTKYYDHPFIRHIAVVSSNLLLFSLGAYYNKIMRNAPVSFHSSEQNALKVVLQKRQSSNEPWLDDKEIEEEHEWLHKSFMYFEGNRLKVESVDDWNANEADYRHNIFLLDKNIIVVAAFGYLTDKHVRLQLDTVKKALAVSRLKKFKLIIDYSGVAGIQRAAKKLLEKQDNEISIQLEDIYIVLSKSIRLVFKMYFFFRPGIPYRFVDNLNEALKLIHSKKANVKKPEANKDNNNGADMAATIRSLDKKQLVEMAINLRKENEEIKKSQNEKISKLFEVISRITWDEDFKPSPIMVDSQEDAFFDLYNSVSLLQQDVYEMVDELKVLNRDLERKVEERTRIIADKEANLSSLIENTRDMICLVDKNYKLLVANKAYQDFIRENYSDEVKPGDNILSGLHEDIVDYWKPYYDRALNGETFGIVETRLIDSRKSFFEILFNPIWSHDREVTGFSVFIRDITPQKEAENIVQRNQQLLESINDNIKEGIFRINENGYIIYSNPAFTEMFGYDSADNMYEIPFGNLYWNQDDRYQMLIVLKAEGRVNNIEIKFKKKDNSFFWGLITCTRVSDPKGNEFYDGVIRDISRMKETDMKLKKQNEELKKVNAELDRFVYSASHDLRAPLLSILGLIGITRIERTEEERSKCLNMMEKCIKKLDNFIQDIINYSRNKRLLVNRERIDFETLLNEIFNDLQYLKKSHSVERRIHVEANDEFYTDLRRLKIIFYNLISNSIVYSATLREPYVEVSVVVKDKFATIMVKDNGQGIPEKHIDKIFDMFYRASEEEAGSGLGLYIVKETIDVLEGNISVSSIVGKGSTFTFTLPNLK